MGPLYVQNFEITDNMVDCYGRLKTSNILFIAQEIAGQHCNELQVDYESLEKLRLFWVVTRHRVQISRIPMRGEKLRVETWPMPTTRVAYPRSMVAYDEKGNECFRSITLWVLMDLDKRSMILPGKSGISVQGSLRGIELGTPAGLVPAELTNRFSRRVSFTDLDRNGHMNNTRYMDWIDDLLPSLFHKNHQVKEFTVCYLSEALEGNLLDLHWDLLEDNGMQVDAYRQGEDKPQRIFSARFLYT